MRRYRLVPRDHQVDFDTELLDLGQSIGVFQDLYGDTECADVF